MLLFIRKFYEIRYETQELGLKFLMLCCASSSISCTFGLNGLHILHIEFSRMQTLRGSLVHHKFRLEGL